MAGHRGARRAVVLAAVLGAGLGAAALSSAHPGGDNPTAAELRDRDPGALVGGNTIVLTGNGGHVLGVHDRPNFIIALGSRDKVIGGSANSEMGALGRNDTIVAGNDGHQLIYGGPRGTIVAGGSGHDLVIDNKPHTTIDLRSPRDDVVLTGHHDHVACSGDSFHDVIYDNHSDTVNKTCHKDHDPVRPDRQFVLARDASPPTAHAAAIGSGTNTNPYTQPCDQGTGSQSPCTVTFPARSLSGFWSTESVPAYRCPTTQNGGSDDPFLVTANFAPFGTTLPAGVQVVEKEPWPIGVSIYHSSTVPIPANGTTFPSDTGTLTGPGNSEALNWSLGTESYRIVLHCERTPTINTTG